VSLAAPPSVDSILDGYQRVASLDANFWQHFEMCRLRIAMGLLGYAASVGDTSLLSRTRLRLRDCIQAITAS
jgi:hypothetical protein